MRRGLEATGAAVYVGCDHEHYAQRAHLNRAQASLDGRFRGT